MYICKQVQELVCVYTIYRLILKAVNRQLNLLAKHQAT